MSAFLSPAKLIENVVATGGMITCVAGKLKLSHPTNALPVPLLEAIALHKVAIIEQLEADRQTDLEERIALIHHDGNIPLLWAMGYAHLCTMPRPQNYKGDRDAWETLINNAGLFLDEWGSKAASLGWQAQDLFAVHREVPTVRYDCMGLLPLLQHNTVIALSENTAKLKTPHNATQTFTRTPFNPDVGCMVWEL